MNSRYLLVMLLGLAGCSNQQVYTAVQDSQKVDCQKYQDTRYEKCLAELDTPYDEYEKDRQALKKAPSVD